MSYLEYFFKKLPFIATHYADVLEGEVRDKNKASWALELVL